MKGGDKMKKMFLISLFLIFSGIIFASECCSSKEKDIKKECNFCKIGNYIICPVMKEKFQVNEKSEKIEYKGKIYIFCCPKCKDKFEKEPEKYIKGN